MQAGKLDISVLLVEDDEDDYVLTRDMLEHLPGIKVNVTWVSTVADAQEALAADEHDICLVDYRLGGDDGLSLLREAPSLGFTGPLVMLTGLGDREVDMAAMEAGASDYLVKGEFDGAQLERTLRYSLTHKHLEASRIETIRQQQARAEAEAANRAKDEFLATVAHELRSPLAAITTWIELLMSGRADEEKGKTGLQVIRDNATRLSRMVEDLLDVSRMLEGRVQLDLKPVDVGAIVRSVSEGLKPRAEQAGIELRVAGDDEPSLVEADGARLAQVIDNLITNALKFTDRGGHIDVLIGREGAWVELEVRDNGIGIDAEQLPRIFDRYRQARTDATGRKGGLGLGLAIARHLVELHGGQIRAESEGINRGTTFHINLPAAEPDPAIPS